MIFLTISYNIYENDKQTLTTKTFTIMMTTLIEQLNANGYEFTKVEEGAYILGKGLALIEDVYEHISAIVKCEDEDYDDIFDTDCIYYETEQEDGKSINDATIEALTWLLKNFPQKS